MIDERRALLRSLFDEHFDPNNSYLCARILLEQIKLDLNVGQPLDMFVKENFSLFLEVKDEISDYWNH